MGLTIAEKRLLLPDDVVAKGHGKVQVIDARTDKIVQEETFENFISQAGLAHNKWQVRKDYALYHPNSASDPEPLYPWQALFLTGDTTAEDPVNQKVLTGEVIGFALKAPQSSSNVYMGSLNDAESTATPTQTKWVFDWPTHAAIGTFQTLAWGTYDLYTANVRDQASYIPYHDWIRPRATTVRNFGDGYRYGLAIDDATGDGYIIANGTTESSGRGYTGIRRLPGLGDATSLPSGVAKFTLTNAAYDLAVEGNNLWYTRNASPYSIDRVALDGAGGAPLQTFAKPWAGSNPGFLAANATHVYVAERNSTTIYKLSATDGSTVASWTTPRPVLELAWDSVNNVLLVAMNNTQLGNAYNGIGYGHEVYVRRYSDTGVNRGEMNIISPWEWYSNNYSLSDIWGMDAYKGHIFHNCYGVYRGSNWAYELRKGSMENLGTRTLLGAPVTKSNLQTLKVTYTFEYA